MTLNSTSLPTITCPNCGTSNQPGNIRCETCNIALRRPQLLGILTIIVVVICAICLISYISVLFRSTSKINPVIVSYIIVMCFGNVILFVNLRYGRYWAWIATQFSLISFLILSNYITVLWIKQNDSNIPIILFLVMSDIVLIFLWSYLYRSSVKHYCSIGRIYNVFHWKTIISTGLATLLFFIVFPYLVTVAYAAYAYNKIIIHNHTTLSILPTEETWNNTKSGEVISLGYGTFEVPHNSVTEIRNPPDHHIVFVDINKNLHFIFVPPFDELETINIASEHDEIGESSIRKGNSEEESLIPDIFDVNQVGLIGVYKSACYTEKKNVIEYLRMSSAEREKYKIGLLRKTTLLAGIEQVKFIETDFLNIASFLRNNSIGELQGIDYHVKSKGSYISQAILFTNENKKLSEADMEMIKSVIASYKYTIDTLPREDKLQLLIDNAVKQHPQYIDEEDE